MKLSNVANIHPKVRIRKSLDKYNQKEPFPEKLAMANESIMKMKNPYPPGYDASLYEKKAKSKKA